MGTNQHKNMFPTLGVITSYYIHIIFKVDRDSFGKSRWALAREALEVLIPKVVERDEDGISLYFFSTGYKKFTNVNTVEAVRWNFGKVVIGLLRSGKRGGGRRCWFATACPWLHHSRPEPFQQL